MSGKKVNIKFEENSFSLEAERQNISNVKIPYNNDIKSMEKEMETLDSFDDFENLIIDSSEYEQKPNSKYGIKYNHEMHGGDEFEHNVLREHELKAAKQFLRDLRGFGLLSDIVGSGKTYEACIVLSELAARNKLKSLLLIVPSQLINSWKYVLEKDFGLGEDVLYICSKADSSLQSVIHECGTTKIDNVIIPKRPILTTPEVFSKWNLSGNEKLFFNAVVVDEAHHLCDEEDKYSETLKLLSELVKSKDRENHTYCLLLSATPHSGNLKKMFRLWYFITQNGGNPNDFNKNTTIHSSDYEKSKRDYEEIVCHGATTIMQFKDRVQLIRVKNKYKEEFERFLSTKQEYYSSIPSTLRNMNNDEKNEIEKIYVQEFLDNNEKIKDEVTKYVASAYHNALLRKIMIRNPHNSISLLHKKNIVNYFLLPTKQKIETKEINGLDLDSNNKIVINFNKIDTSEAIYNPTQNRHYSIYEYMTTCHHEQRYSYSEDYCKIFFDSIFDNSFLSDEINTNNLFTKKGSRKYYIERFMKSSFNTEGIKNYIVPVFTDISVFEYKVSKIKEICQKHENDRVIIFLDYDEAKRDFSIINETEKALKKDTKINKRLIIGNNVDKDKVIEKFTNTSNAVLLVEDESYTEGANLQKCNIIINFQVTPNPLAMDQCIGRIFRMGQENDVTIYSLADMTKLEGYILAYYTDIQLLSSRGDDITIIAGSNNDDRIAIRCPSCGRVKLFDKLYYRKLKESNNRLELMCSGSQLRPHDSIEMTEMGIYNFECGNKKENKNQFYVEKCMSCRGKIELSEEEQQYVCLASNRSNGGIYARSLNSKDHYCQKICVLRHCNTFLEHINAKGGCPILETNNLSESELIKTCVKCNKCTDELAKCRYSLSNGQGKDAIAQCLKCSLGFYNDFSCGLGAHVVAFEENVETGEWEANCPFSSKCKKCIKEVKSSTFASYIRNSWDFRLDNGDSFCTSLGKEANSVSQIKAILSQDEMEEK